ncbi:dihydrodipicolinate synthase family protein [Streptomyces sp. NPDC058045]|uniref:dihydrodipicolinate synthase family protein n=1 Tax=Streptomyces sp. NPDC058045 TaxID=3346311 RepID=UPI0036EA4E3E
MRDILLPLPDGPRRYRPPAPPDLCRTAPPASSRTAFAAAHVVADPAAAQLPGASAVLDWDATLAFRRHLWSLGLGVADAMDTAQRGMGLDWAGARELITRSGAEARATGGRLACGAGTDQLTTAEPSLADVLLAYEEQIEVVEAAGAQVVLMASRALAKAADGPEDYARIYGRLLAQTRRPVILHWLGTAFDPALEGYWGSTDLDRAAATVLRITEENAAQVDGIKISLLDADRETALRRALPEGVRMYTGDDFHYPGLILGDEQGFSDALLGVFDPIAAHAATALQALDRGDTTAYRTVLEPTLPLARHLFAAPTRHYKTGVVFLAHLAGHQGEFTMVGGEQHSRGVRHLAELFRLAGDAGAFPDPDLATARMGAFLTTKGYDT